MKSIECPECHHLIKRRDDQIGAYCPCPNCGATFATEGVAMVDISDGSLPRVAAKPVDPRVTQLDCIDRAAYCLACGVIAFIVIPFYVLPSVVFGVLSLTFHAAASRILPREQTPPSASAMASIGVVFAIVGLVGTLVYLAILLSAYAGVRSSF